MEDGDEMEVDGIDTVAAEKMPAPAYDTTNATKKLPPGFGFTKNTLHVRLSTTNDLCTERDTGTDSLEIQRSNFCGSNSQRRRFNPSKHAVVISDNSGSLSRSLRITRRNESVEIDTIYPRNFRETVLQVPPERVPEDFVDMSPKKLPTDAKATCFCLIPVGKRTPDATSDIYIPHAGADVPKGDEFGARLTTFNDHTNDGSLYFRHFLVQIKPNGPADQMRIDDRDELVLVNETFAPQLTHEEVLDLFKHVKVDGKTRFQLIIRRVQENRRRKWEWIETSAILAPDKAVEDHPTIENLEFKELTGDAIELPKSQQLYKVPGTQHYLDVCDGRVQLDVMYRDKSNRSKLLWKRAKYWQDDDDVHINFAAALLDNQLEFYIGIDSGKIILKRDPFWFRMIKVGNKIRFKFDNVYLGYDNNTSKVMVDVSQCTFEEFQPSDVDMNNFAEESIESLPENNDSISEGSSRHSSISSRSGSIRSNKSVASSVSSLRSVRSSASSRSSVDSNRSSLLSSQSSNDSGGLFYELNGSSCEATGRHCEPTSLSLSQTSGSSGYRSDHHVENEFNDIVKLPNSTEECTRMEIDPKRETGITDLSGTGDA